MHLREVITPMQVTVGVRMVKVLTLSVGPSGAASTQRQCLSYPRITFMCRVDVMVIPDQGRVSTGDPQIGTSILVLQLDLSISEIPGSAVVQVVVQGERQTECELSAEPVHGEPGQESHTHRHSRPCVSFALSTHQKSAHGAQREL